MVDEPMPDGEPSDDNDKTRMALLEVVPTLAPIYEFAEGQRAELERRGWSPTAAESAALTILCATLSRALNG